jgi:DNA transformation protein
MSESLDTHLADLPNVGPVLLDNLKQIGITTPAELDALGSKETFFRIRTTVNSEACLHMLYGIEGAIQRKPYTYLSQETRDSLGEFKSNLREE